MRLRIRIKNFIYLWRENKKEKVNVKLDIEHLFRLMRLHYKIKHSLVRNLTCSIIRKARKEKPYIIQDYSKAKLLYDNVTPIDLSKIKKGSYVFRFSREYPVKGERWCEYFINYSGFVDIYKTHKWNEKYSYWSVEDYTGEWNIFGNAIEEKSARSYRFATPEEITEFKNRQKEYKQKKKEIAIKQEEISKLYREL